MNDGGERDDWIKELSETKEQLGRLIDQLQNIQKQDLQDMIGRIQHLQSRLDAIKDWLQKKRN